MALPGAAAPPRGWTGVISRVQYRPPPASDQPGFKGRFAAEKQENSWSGMTSRRGWKAGWKRRWKPAQKLRTVL